MANIHLNRNRQSLGQFSPEDVADGLQSGRFLPTDLGWTEGMPSWKPLSEFSDLPAVEVPTPSVAPGIELTGSAPTEIQPAWERRSEVGLFQGLFQTVRDSIAQPGSVFASLNPNGGLIAPLTFYLIIGMIGSLVALGYQFGITLVDPSSLGKGMEGKSPEMVWAVMGTAFVIILVMLPFVLAIGAFLSAGFVHLSLMLLGCAKKPFRTTFQVTSYANGAALIFQIVPACGGVIAWVYGIVLTVIGIQKAHHIETSKAVIAVLLPVVLCCGALVALGAVAGAAGLMPLMEEFAKQSSGR